MHLSIRGFSVVTSSFEWKTYRHPAALRSRNSAFALCEDQNDGYGYERGLSATIRFEWNDRSRTLTVESRHGDCPGMTRDRKFLVVLVKPHHGVGLDRTSRPERVISYTGSQVIVQVGAKGEICCMALQPAGREGSRERFLNVRVR
jgi:hypothetical protein